MATLVVFHKAAGVRSSSKSPTVS